MWFGPIIGVVFSLQNKARSLETSLTLQTHYLDCQNDCVELELCHFMRIKLDYDSIHSSWIIIIFFLLFNDEDNFVMWSLQTSIFYFRLINRMLTFSLFQFRVMLQFLWVLSLWNLLWDLWAIVYCSSCCL